MYFGGESSVGHTDCKGPLPPGSFFFILLMESGERMFLSLKHCLLK